ncbi:MAG: CoA transferase [Candidatus Binataceae bacterium]|nr:CoA transferase [Candidatus Binataceae bacterium]
MTTPTAIASGALAGLRVLDLTDYTGHLCARLMADLGADVVKIEPPGGDSGRRIGPFVDDLPHPNRSLFFWFYNFNKRSLTLNLEAPRGREILLDLARSADVVIENFAPGRADAMGLGWERLHAINPALVMLSMSPFGQDGPYRDFVADDTVLTAMGGMLYVNGYPGRPPVRPLGLQGYHPASFYGAIAIMCALFARDRDSIGQWIDLSMQAATAGTLEHVVGGYFQNGVPERRRGTMHWSRFFRVGKCSDGYVMHCTIGDWTSLIEWVKSDGAAQELVDPAWEAHAHRAAHAERLFDVLDQWVADRPRDEIVARAQLLRQPYAAVRHPEELFDDEQLRARNFFVEVDHPELGKKFLYPGAPAIMHGTPWRIYRRPPLLGEHTIEILRDELDLPADELQVLTAEGVL